MGFTGPHYKTVRRKRKKIYKMADDVDELSSTLNTLPYTEYGST